MATSRPQISDEHLYEQVIDTLNKIFGSNPGYRPVHAKGALCEGVFQATADASALTRAPHMSGARVPVIVRFSIFSGIPTASDGDPTASPQGMAVRFQMPDGSSTDIVAHSYNGFPARTASEFLEFLQALAAGSGEASRPNPLERFVMSHPAAKRFVEDPKPTPESFATESFYAVDTFRFVDAEGNKRHGRYRIIPAAGERHLDAQEAARRPRNFLFDDLTERLSRRSVEFRLIVQMAGQNDPLDDPTQLWPEDRRKIEIGTISVKRILPDSETIQRNIAFDPARLPDGIEPGDPLIAVRSQVYALALRRRKA